VLITDGPNGEKHLLDVLIAAADTAPDQTITHVRGDGTERVVTHRQLRDEALKVAGGLHEAGIAAGTPVILLADGGDDFQPMFWGALAAGLVPVPLPAEPTRVAGVRDLLGGVPVIVDDACTPVAQAADAPALHIAGLRTGPTRRQLPTPDPDEPAFLQFSSGSTGTPRGVELRHRNVLANLRQIGQAAALTSDDVSVSWMPYFHDMGLIGTHLAPLAARLRQVRIGPLTFAKRPLLWFSAAHRHRATLLSAANFALALAVRRVPAEALAGLDLSAVRLMMVGAEPISPVVWRAFVERTRPAGLDPAALQPVYGLAEATLAVTVPPLGEVAVPVRVDRAALAAGTVQQAGEGDPDTVEFIDVGRPVPGCQVRVVDEAGRAAGDGRVGRIEVRGPNVAAGYHGDSAATAEVFVDGWLRTGDLGFLRDGRLCVTGRAKDVVFVNGRTFHAADLEEVVAGTAGLPAGRVAVLGCTDHDSGAERIVVFVQWARPPADAAAVLARVAARIVTATGHDQVRVLPVPAGAFPRTTSGKLRRPRLRQRYAAGDFAAVEQRWAATTPPTSAIAPTMSAVAGGGSRDEVERVVRAVWARVLRRPADEIGPHDRFTTLGGSSLQAMEVLAGLEDAFGRELDPAELRERATVAALADHLLTPVADGRVEPAGPASGPAAGPTGGPAAAAAAGAADGVAIIGLACRFPGADSPDEFWRQLLDGRDSVGEIPPQRWRPAKGDTARWGAFLDDPAGFDAGFFGMSDTDADHTDPHARIFLELAHEALERAGYAGPRRHGRRVGVFAAVGESGYTELLRAESDVTGEPAALVGNLRNLIPARVAQALDLAGPAIAVDTACSSALVALHLAVRSLRDRECDLAVVGGVNLNLTPTGHRLLAAAGALSPTGRCRVFATDADGFVPGEGGAALVLARVDDARAAGDELLALVRGTAVNNDGRSLSLLAPNPLRQRDVIVQAYRDSGVDPAMVSYVEAHGTGTELGDPVEVRSLAYAFPPRPDGRPRLIGSVKSNIGHLLNAAGMPALVKVVLALRHRQLPPSLHVDTPSPRLDLAGAGFELVTGARDWVDDDAPLTAGVNAFGFGGTNAHAILQQATPAPVPQRAAPAAEQAAEAASAGPYLLTCSAATEAALRQSLRDLAAHLDAHPELDPGDVCATVNTARDDRPHRVAVVADSTAGLAAALAAAASGPATEVVRRPRTAVVWPGDETDGETGPTAVCRRLADWGVMPDAVTGDDADQLRALLDQGYDVLLGADPDRLTRAVRDASPQSADRVEVLSVPPTDADGGLTGLVGALWQRGVAVDRVRLSDGRRRVAVPTYPFQRRRHWLPEAAKDRDGLVHQVCWSPLPLLAGRSPGSVHLTGPGAALGCPLADGLRDRLAADGIELANGIGDADLVVYLASGDAFDIDGGVAGLDAAVDATLRGVTGLVAALPERGFRLLVVTQDAVSTGATGERPDPMQSLVTGLTAALADEHPDSTVSGVDLSATDDVPARIVALATELATVGAQPDPAAVESRPVESRPVAWRGGQRLGRRLVPTSPIGEEPTEPVDADGVQLIVGGTGGVGAALAADLAARGHRRIVLAGRADAAPDGLVNRLRALGAQVGYRRCDLTDAADVDALIAGLPDLAGVFHAAGVVRPGPLRSRSVGQLRAVLAPKVRGGHLLVQALRRYGRRPATVVAFTSVSALLPGLAGAVGDYAAANAFLDTYAAVERAAGRPLRTVGFSALADAGMAAHPGLATRLAARGLPALPFDDALPALRSALRRPGAHLVVARLTAASAVPVAAASVAAPTAPAAAVPQQPAARSGDAGRQPHTPGEIRDVLRRLLADALDCDPARIDDETPFLSLGLDSLTAIDLVKTLEGELGRPLPTMLLFEHGTIAALVDRLADPPPAVAPTAVTGDDNAEPFALSGVQLAFHTLHRLYPQVAAYGFVRHAVTGPLDADLLGQALEHLTYRHPMLRMRWTDDDGTAPPRQLIGPPTPLTDWYAVHDDSDGAGDIDALTERLCNEPIDLTRRPPLRAALIRTGPADAQLLLVLHHAAGDGASLSVLSEELWQVYGALAAGRVPQLPPVPATFRDHLAVAAPARAEDLAFWRETLASWPAGLRLPWRDQAAPPAPPYVAHQVAVDPPTVAALTRVAAAAQVSLFHLLLAGYARCLARSSGQRTVTVSVARAGRDTRLPGVDRVVGPFADTLPVTVDVDPTEPAADLARRVLAAWLVAQRHGTVDAVDLARATPRPDDPAGGGGRPVTTSPASFSFARFPVMSDADLPVRVSPVAAGTASAGTRLGLLCWPDGERLRFAWNHPVASLDRAMVAGLAADFLAELADLANQTDPPSTESTLGVLPSVVERIGQVCRRHADAVAVEAGELRMTYRQLDAAADRVAAALRHHGVQVGDLVGLLAARGPAAVAAIVGVLRAGAGWVPLDVAHPAVRHRDQLRRSGAQVLLHDTESTTLADALAGLVTVDIDTIIVNGTAVAPVTDGAAAADPDGTAYVIFTSGSTGRPKGVPVSHRSTANYLHWAVDTFGYHSGDRLAQTSSLCFDASVRQLLAPLLVGATVVVLAPQVLRDPDEMLRRVEHDRITVWSSVPTLWGQLLAAAQRRTTSGGRPDLSALRWIHVGGETLPPGQVRSWFDLFGPGHRITNLYGPTEATINAAWFLIDRRPADGLRRVPIGRPVAGATLAVVDAAGRPCPPGEAGELLIAGPGLTSDYLDDPGQTAAVFVHRDGRRWYRSGDRVRVGPTGDLEFLGRLDDQVKLHGHRIEPGEIEAALGNHPAVATAVVLLQTEPYPRLVAYAQLRDPGADAATDAADLRRHLADRLPPQWVPARIHLVRELPTTTTGKVDRLAFTGLPSEDADPADDAPPPVVGEAPRTGTERRLAQVWQSVLGLPAVHREDDFFAIGGNSIVALDVFARLREHFPALPRPTVIYDHRTLAGLAAAIDEAATRVPTADTSAPDVPGPDAAAADVPGPDAAAADVPTVGYDPRPFPLAPAQRGFLLAEAVAPGSSSTWLARLRLSGRLNRRRFQQAVDVTVARHPMLRTVFPAGARPPVQQELPATLRLPVLFETIESADQLDSRVADLVDDRVARERQRTLEPWAWPLLRLLVLTVGPDEHVLLVHAHHLIGDGYSAALLGRELLALHDALAAGAPVDVAPLRTTFRAYVAWLRQRQDDPDPQADRWWRERFGQPYRPPTLRTPTGATATEVPGRAHTAGFTLDSTVSAQLDRLAAAAGCSGYAPVLTAYRRGLARLTGQDDLVIGLTVTGRDHPLPDLHRLFGPCAVLLPLRLTGAGRAFDDDLAQVAGEVATARRHGAEGELISAESAGSRPTAMLAGAQFIFSSLDFTGIGPTGDGAPGGLTLHWDDGDSELEPPPVGTDVLLTARPVDAGLRVTVRATAQALDPDRFADFVAAMAADLIAAGTDTAGTDSGPVAAAGAGLPTRRATGPDPGAALDAAIVGYLPAPAQLARLAGVPAAALPREQIRELLFPDGAPRLLEELVTPLGRSGFVCLPLFADELDGGVAGVVARAVEHAAGQGARCVSLAGLVPSFTGYGFDVLRQVDPAVRVTTGHATTATSVVLTTLAALDAVGRDLAAGPLAVVGLGSIGRSALELLLGQGGQHPPRIVLADLPASRRRLADYPDRLRRLGYRGDLVWADSTPTAAPPVYAATTIVAAVSSATEIVDVDRLRPGTVLVDDSFPHCVNPAAALRRMRDDGDVLVVGGGLLSCGPVRRVLPAGLPAAAVAGYAARAALPDTVASCQLESLLQADRPELPLVHGLVDTDLAAAYWSATRTAGTTAAPLHLGDATVAELIDGRLAAARHVRS